MSIYRIAVVTENAQVADFFRLELKLYGVEADVLDSSDKLSGAYDVAVVDTDTCRMPSECECAVIPLSKNNVTNISADGSTLGWPLLLTDVQVMILGSVTDRHGGREASLSSSQRIFISVYPDEGEAELEGERIRLSKNELAILSELCKNFPKTVSRARIMELLGATEGNISDVYIYHLRKKLERDTGRRLIFTERSKGYRTVLIRKN